MVFMIDEFNHDANIKYYNNNDLVLHFKSLGWNILIYGIDNQWWWIGMKWPLEQQHIDFLYCIILNYKNSSHSCYSQWHTKLGVSKWCWQCWQFCDYLLLGEASYLFCKFEFVRLSCHVWFLLCDGLGIGSTVIFGWNKGLSL